MSAKRSTPSPEISQLLAIMDAAYDKPSWHGPNLRGSVRRITAQQAAWRPAGDRLPPRMPPGDIPSLTAAQRQQLAAGRSPDEQPVRRPGRVVVVAQAPPGAVVAEDPNAVPGVRQDRS